MAEANHQLLTDLDARSPDFARHMLCWSFQTRCEIGELVALTKQTIVTSRTLMAEADRILTRK